MAYDNSKWLKRLRARNDISGFITHFTKERGDVGSVDVLIEILKSKKINGSTTSKGFIVGPDKAVCFQDAPIGGLTQNLIHEQYNLQPGANFRYRGIGLSFAKRYAFEKGARPVIYEKKDIAKNFLPESEWWRIVSFDLSDSTNIIDWTHEREWRLKGDFEFTLSEAYIYLLDSKTYRSFLEKAGLELVKEIKGIVILDPVLT